jgi:hypothetical protein
MTHEALSKQKISKGSGQSSDLTPQEEAEVLEVFSKYVRLFPSGGGFVSTHTACVLFQKSGWCHDSTDLKVFKALLVRAATNPSHKCRPSATAAGGGGSFEVDELMVMYR